MPTIIDNRNNLDNTVKIFDEFYNFNLVVDGSKYDIVYGYFFNKSKSKQIANNFTTFLFRIAQETGINVLTLLQELQGTGNQLQLTGKIAYYLNSLKSKAALYGISRIPPPIVPVARNVVL